MMDGAERSSRTPPRGSRLPPASSLSDPYPVPDGPPPLQPHWHLRLLVQAPRLRPPRYVVLRTPTGTGTLSRTGAPWHDSRLFWIPSQGSWPWLPAIEFNEDAPYPRAQPGPSLRLRLSLFDRAIVHPTFLSFPSLRASTRTRAVSFSPHVACPILGTDRWSCQWCGGTAPLEAFFGLSFTHSPHSAGSGTELTP